MGRRKITAQVTDPKQKFERCRKEFRRMIDTVRQVEPIHTAFCQRADTQPPTATECLIDTLKMTIYLKATSFPASAPCTHFLYQIPYIKEVIEWEETTIPSDIAGKTEGEKIKYILQKYCQQYDNEEKRKQDFKGDPNFYLNPPAPFKTYQDFFEYCRFFWDQIVIEENEAIPQFDSNALNLKIFDEMVTTQTDDFVQKLEKQYNASLSINNFTKAMQP